MESWCLWRVRGLLRREAGTREVWAAVGREAGDGPRHEGPPTPAPTRCLCCGGGGGAISGTKTHSGGGEGASQGSDFGTSLVTWREGRVQRRTSLLKVESEQGVTQAAGKGPEKGCGRERSIPSCHHEGAQPARWKRSSASAQSFQIRASGRSLQSPENLLQSRDGLVSSPRGNPALQRFLCTRGFPTPPSLSFQSWFPLIDVQRPGQSPGPLPGWGPPPGSCPAPRLAHLFRGVIGIIGLWRTQGCHLPLGSIWDTGKAGQHGPCALIPRARDLRGASWEQSGRRADRCHCGDLEGGLRVTMPGDL
ncbi:uncharacterized protein [Pseudorca crassidens]|uniref:uncharacterized protein n=1 Tax=Pseudorca crassidens TaxID=82174 RepID=UPI00352C207F